MSAPDPQAPAADLERRFGGLRRLYGDAAYQRLRGLRLAVVGLGGVGSWAVEALARSGVAGLVLIDLDHVAESNINRQVQALGQTVGMAKGLALQQRIADIHPGCQVQCVEDFVTPENWPGLLPLPVDGVFEACDQVRAKHAVAAWALQHQVPIVTSGAAGGKRQPHRLEVDDLAAVTHDPLLASLRQRLRKFSAAPRSGAIGLRCVFSREPVRLPEQACEMDGSLNCHGYGSSVTVTAAVGMAAAAELIEQCLATRPRPAPANRPDQDSL
ncbi:MAG: tRNA threonylcarbamoyladenosine dehydratase [Ideonella sp. MAG2]|nr:MAG: tRNA threonylcarbamoyladenosine dehydratase [Ideonella sp. MAG2]